MYFNLLFISVWQIFYLHLSWRDSSFKCFSNKTLTFVTTYPKHRFNVCCPTFLFSKLVRSLVELWINHINFVKCLAVKRKCFLLSRSTNIACPRACLWLPPPPPPFVSFFVRKQPTILTEQSGEYPLYDSVWSPFEKSWLRPWCHYTTASDT